MSADEPERSARIEISSERAVRFADSDLGRCVHVDPKPLFGPGEAVFTIGSSFAQSLRGELRNHGHPVVPDYAGLDLDPARQSAGQLAHINYYTAATIRQEIERALADPGADPILESIAAGRWPVKPNRAGAPVDSEPWEARFQDPRRHGVVARTEVDIIDLMSKIDVLVRDGLATASAYVVTLALTECWIDPGSGHYLWSQRAANVSPDPDRFDFRQSSYEETYDDMAWVCETIATRFPGRPIVLTVSPVIPPRTFTTGDTIVANTHGKAVLRAAAGELAAQFPHVSYWPSFEFSMAANARQPDGRHMTPAAVQHDVAQFVAAHRATPHDPAEARPDVRD